MKTPKRNHITVNHYRSADYREYRTHIELARWQRKNRIRALKHTIARQAEEIEHYKNLLALHITADRYRSTQTCIEWAAKHIRVETHPNKFEYDQTTQQLTVTIPPPDVFIDGLKYPTAQFIKTYAKP